MQKGNYSTVNLTSVLGKLVETITKNKINVINAFNWGLYDFSLHMNPMAFFEGICNHMHQRGLAVIVFFNFQTMSLCTMYSEG